MNSLDDILSQKADKIFFNQNQTGSSQSTADAQPAAESKEIDFNQLKSMVYSLKNQLDGIIRLLNKDKAPVVKINAEADTLSDGENIVEGVFNGEKMVGDDGKEYEVPANYASKSKLVEGDLLKLTIAKNGSFIYKQISPTERKRLVGELVADSDSGQWKVLAEGKDYRVLTASVTFYKGKTGDEAVILVPQAGKSQWAAIDNIIK